jgi:hypothetical protein
MVVGRRCSARLRHRRGRLVLLERVRDAIAHVVAEPAGVAP